MKPIVYIVAAFTLLFSTVYADDYLRLGTDCIVGGQDSVDITFYILRECPTPTIIGGSSNGFVITSSGDANWTYVDVFQDSNSSVVWDLGGLLVTPVFDGFSPDTFLVGGTGYPGMPIITEEEPYFHLILDIGSGEGEICIDSAFVFSAGAWKWSSLTCGVVPGYPDRPSFRDVNNQDGSPFCITVTAYCPAPQIVSTLPDDELTLGWCDSASHQFEAEAGGRDYQGEITGWDVIAGPGDIDSNGLYQVGPLPAGDYPVIIRTTNDCPCGGLTDEYTFSLVGLISPTVTPPQNAVNVSVESDIVVTFSTDIDESSVDSSSFVVFSSSRGFEQGVMTYDEVFRAITYSPSEPFMTGDVISVTLTEDIKCLEGFNYSGFSWSFTAAVDDGSGNYIERTDYSVGDSPHCADAADLDGDGDLDLAVANYVSDGVSVLLNDGVGTFTHNGDYIAGDKPWAVCSADFDKDGDLDLATSNYGAFTVAVLMNNGDGTYAPRTVYSIGSYPKDINTGDLDNDGDTDLFTCTGADENDVWVLWNNGDGTFNQSSFNQSGYLPFSVVAADIDSDGDLDLITANLGSDNISVMFNNGYGTFPHYTSYSAGDSCRSVASADFDGDGDIDLVTANAGSDDLSLFLNDGNGVFSLESNLPAGTQPWYVYAADLDGDGDMDIATPNQGEESVSILLNNGDANFEEHVTYPVGVHPQSVHAADLDGNGDLDLVTTNWTSNSISVLFNNSAPSILSPGDTVTAQNQQLFAYYPTIDDDDDSVHTISYTAIPHWCSVQTDSVIGVAPDTLFTEELTVIAEDDCSADTMSFTVTIYLSGDADRSGVVDIDDVVFLINYIFAGGAEPSPYVQGDVDCSGMIDIDDVVYLIQYIFAGGPPPGDPDNDGIPDC